MPSSKSLLALALLIPANVLAQAVLDQTYGDGGHLDKYGTALISIGDINSDNVPDYAVGAPEIDETPLNDNGVVYFYSGADRTLLGRFSGSSGSERAGIALALVSDLDADGLDDLAVGSSTYNGAGGFRQGKITIVSTQSFNEIDSFSIDEAGIEFGSSLANVGDRDGDSFDDLLVGAPESSALATGAGSAFLLSVSDTNISQLARFDGTQADEAFGFAVSTLGDVTGDSLPELVISSPFYTGLGIVSGRVQVFSGAAGYPFYTQIEGQNNGEKLGWKVAQIEDPSGGATARLLISSVGASFGPSNPNAGACAIYDVASGLAIRVYNSQVSAMHLGFSMTVVPDQDGDDIDDILIGSPLESVGGLTRGVAELLSSDGDGAFMKRLFRIRGPSAGDRCGESVAGLGDLDQDGEYDFGWGCSGVDNPMSGLATGGVDLIRGRVPRLSTDMEFYNDLDPFTLSGVGYADTPVFLLLTFVPGGSVPIFGLSTDSDGHLLLGGTFPNTGGVPYQLTFQFFFLKPNSSTGLIVSEPATIQVN